MPVALSAGVEDERVGADVSLDVTIKSQSLSLLLSLNVQLKLPLAQEHVPVVPLAKSAASALVKTSV